MQFTPVHTNVMYAMHAVTCMHTTTPLCTSLQINYSETYVDNFRAYIYTCMLAHVRMYVCTYVHVLHQTYLGLSLRHERFHFMLHQNNIVDHWL